MVSQRLGFLLRLAALVGVLSVPLSAIPVQQYRASTSLSPAERKQRDDTGKLAVELYQRSRDVPSALNSALQLLHEAAQLGHVEAQQMLGYHLVYRSMSDSEKRMEGFSWLAAAAEQGPASAKRTLIDALVAYEDIDPARAIAEMESLAAQGELDQYIILSYMHREGRLGLTPDPVKAVQYLERGVAFSGNSEVPGYRNWLMDHLAAACFQGSGTPRDLARAAKLLRESAMEGSIQSTPGDIYRVYFYATGEHGFPRDLKKAQELLEHIHPTDWRPHQPQLDAAKAALTAALAANEKVDPAATAFTRAPPTPDEMFWSDRPDALTAIERGNYLPGHFLVAQAGIGGAPAGPATVKVWALFDAAGNLVDARIRNSPDTAYNRGALLSVRNAKFNPAKGSGPSLGLVDVLFRAAK